MRRIRPSLDGTGRWWIRNYAVGSSVALDTSTYPLTLADFKPWVRPDADEAPSNVPIEESEQKRQRSTPRSATSRSETQPGSFPNLEDSQVRAEQMHWKDPREYPLTQKLLLPKNYFEFRQKLRSSLVVP